MIPVRLHWERPADGVEIAIDKKLAAWHLKGDGRVARMRSERVVQVTYEITNLENPIVLHLINCSSDEERGGFISRFGFLEREGDFLRGFIPGLHIAQLSLADALSLPSLGIAPATDLANIVVQLMGFDVTLRPSFERSGSGGTLGLALHPDSLGSFLAMEIAMAHQMGAVAATCQHCGKIFLTGPMTGRRSHAKYCSDRCRVAAMRKRNAAKGV